MISLEKDASIARSNIRNAGLGDVVEVRIGKERDGDVEGDEVGREVK